MDAIPRTSDAARGQALDDPQRLRVLRATRLLDSAPEESFDRLTRLAAHMLGVPVAQVVLLDEDRQFFKSRLVLDRDAPERETGLERSFCQHVVTAGSRLVVPDSREDERLRDNLASLEDDVVAYCGCPLRLSDGNVLGTLCAVDRVPRDWTEHDVDVLADLSAMVVAEIELRLALSTSQRRADELADAARGLRSLQGALDTTAQEREHARAASLDLAATLAHEIRTPLFAIRGMAEVMLAETPADGAVYRDIQTIDRTAQEALVLVDEQLQLARAEAGHAVVALQDVSVGEILGALRGLMRTVPRAPGVEFVVEPAPADVPVLRTDSGKLTQVLRNLVANALRHTTEGEVRVVARLTPDGEHVAFTVTDTGEGIDPADHERIFEPYTRVGDPADERGAGLGLPLARRLAQLLGGTVTVSSAQGAGARFTATVATRFALADAPDGDAVHLA